MTLLIRGSGLGPRKSPHQKRSKATVAAVVEAAARILESRGLQAYTTNAVAKVSGVSIGSLYQYFPNKDSITQALIAREAHVLVAEVERAASSAEGWEVLAKIVEVAVRNQLRRPSLANILDFEEQRLPVSEGMAQLGAQLVNTIGVSLSSASFEQAGSDPFAVQDLIAIVRGMVDGAGARGERDETALASRVQRAVFGYLQKNRA
ncbi:TetR family transcriptional regulator [Bosea sp. AK1]|uniref:TetR/AcrR family transcriptional regulator n=1 Tax=Bosea sp. AK1 TaxID=2587160 RepID=UPI0011508452|nr:TetR/AcrR family transcriptional regulator [Bosea sp. AK1]TQI65354.1 TetR family transcriptional regulator [Bosea sp. AK1]